MENCAYDENGNMLASTFSDYTPITAVNMPTLEIRQHRDTLAAQL
jgi:CO/xanthine dehydrogenase Mo-binding subunit